MKITLDFTEMNEVMINGLGMTFLACDVSESYVVSDVKQVGANSWGEFEVTLRRKPNKEDNITYPCKHCGAGDEIHHSYSCPTNLHPDKRL